MESKCIVLKLYYDTVVKRVRKMPQTFIELKEFMQSEFPALDNSPFCIQYKDSDNDIITVTTDADLLEAYQQAEESEAKTLKMVITKGEKNPTNSSFDNCIRSLVTKETTNCKDQIEDLAKKEVTKSKIKIDGVASVIHAGILCNGCKMQPITGIRYKCSMCPNYNLCSTCEANGIHAHHALMKIKSENVMVEPIKNWEDVQGEEEKEIMKNPFLPKKEKKINKQTKK